MFEISSLGDSISGNLQLEFTVDSEDTALPPYAGYNLIGDDGIRVVYTGMELQRIRRESMFVMYHFDLEDAPRYNENAASGAEWTLAQRTAASAVATQTYTITPPWFWKDQPYGLLIS